MGCWRRLWGVRGGYVVFGGGCGVFEGSYGGFEGRIWGIRRDMGYLRAAMGYWRRIMGYLRGYGVFGGCWGGIQGCWEGSADIWGSYGVFESACGVNGQQGAAVMMLQFSERPLGGSIANAAMPTMATGGHQNNPAILTRSTRRQQR